MPDSLTSIGGYAFYECTSLTSITIPENVTSIDKYAFYNCTSLIEINFNAITMNALADSNYVFYCAGQKGAGISLHIGSNVTRIPSYLFDPYYKLGNDYSPKILSVDFDANSNCKSIGSNAFYYCKSIVSIILPESITSIEKNAFVGCNRLVEINNLSSLEITAGSTDNGSVAYYADIVSVSTSFESGIICEEDYVFYSYDGSYYLVEYVGLDSEITLPENINGYSYSIHGLVFYYDTSIKSVVMSDGVVSIGSSAFEYCSNLTSVTIGNNVISIGDRAFYICKALAEVNIGNNVTSIGNSAFYTCTSLKTITIPDSVTSIGDGAFMACSLLNSIAMPDGITSIGESVLYDSAYYNDSANWENGVLYIGNYLIRNGSSKSSGDYTTKEGTILIADAAFYGAAYNNIIVSDSVTIVGDRAFQGCSSLKSIVLGNGVTSVGDYAFSYCTLLESVTIGSSAVSIGEYAFQYCTKLTSVTMGNDATSVVEYAAIGNYAFSGCTALESIVIGNGITSIGDYAFYKCNKLVNIVIPDSVKSVGEFAFGLCSLLESVSIGDGVSSIGRYAFEYCTSLKSVIIGDSVSSIGRYAFEYCSKLTSVTFENTNGWYVTQIENATSGTNITSDQLSNVSTAAGYLMRNYYYYWYRSEN